MKNSEQNAQPIVLKKKKVRERGIMDAHQLVDVLQRYCGRRLRWETAVASGEGTWVARDEWRDRTPLCI